MQGVTDAGLCALAEAGCGRELTSLFLQGGPLLFPNSWRVEFEFLSAGNRGVTEDNFAAALGLPREFHDTRQFSPQAVYHEWSLRRRGDVLGVLCPFPL